MRRELPGIPIWIRGNLNMGEGIFRFEIMFPSFEADDAITGVTMVSSTIDNDIAWECPFLGREKENMVSGNLFDGPVYSSIQLQR